MIRKAEHSAAQERAPSAPTCSPSATGMPDSSAAIAPRSGPPQVVRMRCLLEHGRNSRGPMGGEPDLPCLAWGPCSVHSVATQEKQQHPVPAPSPCPSRHELPREQQRQRELQQHQAPKDEVLGALAAQGYGDQRGRVAQPAAHERTARMPQSGTRAPQAAAPHSHSMRAPACCTGPPARATPATHTSRAARTWRSRMTVTSTLSPTCREAVQCPSRTRGL